MDRGALTREQRRATPAGRGTELAAEVELGETSVEGALRRLGNGVGAELPEGLRWDPHRWAPALHPSPSNRPAHGDRARVCYVPRCRRRAENGGHMSRGDTGRGAERGGGGPGPPTHPVGSVPMCGHLGSLQGHLGSGATGRGEAVGRSHCSSSRRGWLTGSVSTCGRQQWRWSRRRSCTFGDGLDLGCEGSCLGQVQWGPPTGPHSVCFPAAAGAGNRVSMERFLLASALTPSRCPLEMGTCPRGAPGGIGVTCCPHPNIRRQGVTKASPSVEASLLESGGAEGPERPGGMSRGGRSADRE
nr:uncharacterized protein LOC116278354 [Vicugna pacos]XP_031529232.1 uncharacterized protein LOC116278354 [Vicugna pacos]